MPFARSQDLALKSKNIRRRILDMVHAAQSGHPGGSLSCVEILAALFFYKMRYDPGNPSWGERDRFVLSKGHVAPALYATLAEAGFFPVEELKTLRKLDSRLQGHASNATPGIEVSTGSLGQGLSVANGIALAAKIDKVGYRVYVLLGDGECQEGQVWEAAMSAAHYRLDKLTAIVDRNQVQQTGRTEDIMRLEPLAEKFRAFGWHVIETDGHNVQHLAAALDEAGEVHGKPTVIIADTVKGKGVSFMENRHEWHGAAPGDDDYRRAVQELG